MLGIRRPRAGIARDCRQTGMLDSDIAAIRGSRNYARRVILRPIIHDDDFKLRAGLLPGDHILKVDGVQLPDTRQLKMTVDLLRGKPGSDTSS